MYRKLTEEDFELIKKAIEADPWHSKDPNFKPEIFRDGPNVQSLVFEDNQGPVMYATFRKEMRVYIQFCNVDKARIRSVFSEYIEIFAAVFKKMGYIAINFTANTKALAWFMRKFGFHTEEVQRKTL
jgi:hypothetical protein